MPIDLSKLDRSEWISVLGSGDWEIVLPDPYPALRISATWRLQRQSEVAERFVRWVLKRDPLDTLDDPHQDRLGEACSDPAEVERRLDNYGSLLEWARGETVASSSVCLYRSDVPFALTYEDHLDLILNQEIDCLIMAQLGYPEGDPRRRAAREDLDTILYDLNELLFEPTLTAIGPMSTRQAWQLYEASVRARLIGEAIRTARVIARPAHGT